MLRDLKDENRECRLFFMKFTGTDKEIVQDVLSRMPDDASLHDIAQELEFIAAVRHGLAEFDENKDSISIEAVKRELPSWSVTVGRQRRGRHGSAGRSGQSAGRQSGTGPKARAKRKAGDSLKPPAPSPNA